MSDVGDPRFPRLGSISDIRTDLPRYRLAEGGRRGNRGADRIMRTGATIWSRL